VVWEEALKVTAVIVHVKVAGDAMLTSGLIMFCETVVETDAEHPFAGSVTVTE
jgi:hypothetical protein